jgi:hypothetical protein
MDPKGKGIVVNDK